MKNLQKISRIKKELHALSSMERKKSNEWFFKTGEGQYGYGDKFIGVTVPNTRKVAGKYKDLALEEIGEILKSDIHEERLLALIIITNQAKKAKVKIDKLKAKEKFLEKTLKELKVEKSLLKKIAKFYLKNKKFVNNWDLVDTSTHYILGNYILVFPEEKIILEKLTSSKSLWDRRIAMVSTWVRIREGKFGTTFALAKKLLGDKEDLMHKAVGWMLHEVYKKDPVSVEIFLQKNYKNLPRTTLRYAIEKMDNYTRKNYLSGSFLK